MLRIPTESASRLSCLDFIYIRGSGVFKNIFRNIKKHALSGFLLLTVLQIAIPERASAAELSLLTGLFKSESVKNEGQDGGGAKTFSLGASFGDEFDIDINWLVFGGLSIQTYDAAAGQAAPSNATGLELGGGMRYFLDPFTATAVPYLTLYGSFKNTQTVDGRSATGASVERDTSGLFYGMKVGTRLALTTVMYLDVEAGLFESSLFSTETRTTRAIVDGQVVKSESETTRVEVFGDLIAPFNSLTFGLGLLI